MIPTLGIRPTAGSEHTYDITPGSVVGSITIGRRTFDIAPKLSIDRVLFLVSHAPNTAKWKPAPTTMDLETSLVEAIIPAFSSHIQRALVRGLLQGYRTEREQSATIRGRILFADQLRRSFSLPLPVHVEYDDFTTDIVENRLLKAAIRRLGSLRLRSTDSRRRLREADAHFVEIAPVAYDSRSIPEIPITRLNERYAPALSLARLILKNGSFEVRSGSVHATAVLFDMNAVFEDFAVLALRDALGVSAVDFPQGAKDRGLFLDAGRQIQLQPDFSLWQGTACLMVGDVKYKRLATAGGPNADVYQVLAYATALGLAESLLIYAAGETDMINHTVRNAGVTIYVRPLHLAGSEVAILHEIHELADLIRAMARRQVRRAA
jgi:5-methylcytosine-specific restriction enzyme subunit McrC